MVRPGTEVIHLRRLRLAGGETVYRGGRYNFGIVIGTDL